MLKRESATPCETMTADAAPATVAVAVAELAWDGESMESVFAVVRESAHVRLLTHTHRLVGAPVDREADVLVLSSPATSTATPLSAIPTHTCHDTAHASTTDASALINAARNTSGPASSAAMLRLRLEEIYVGLYHGFLALRHSDFDTRAFTRALLDAAQRPSTALASAPIDPAKRHRLTLSPTQATRLRVFCDLWTRGYFVAFGSKFSSELLIYDDAPAQSHATALVLVRTFDAPFHTVDIVGHCRVAKMVKKHVFLASCESTRASSSPADDDCSGNGTREDAVVYIAIDHALLATRQEI